MSDPMRGSGNADTRLTDPNPSEVGSVRIETTDTDTSDDTKDEAKARANEVKQTAQQEGQRVQEEVKHQASNFLSQVTDQARQQAETQTSRFADFLSSLADQAEALTEGRMDDAGQFGQYAQQLGDQTRRFASSVEDRGFSGLIDDVQRFARRRPGVFLLGAAAAGAAVGRFGRAAKDAGDDSSSGPAGQLPANTSGSDDSGNRIAHRSAGPAGRTAGTVPPPATGTGTGTGTGTVDDPTTGNVISPEPGRVSSTQEGRRRG